MGSPSIRRSASRQGQGAARASHRRGHVQGNRLVNAKFEVEVGEGKLGVNAEGTFGALLDAWLVDRKQRAPTAINGHKINIESTIRPALGSIPLNKLTSRDLDGFYKRLLAEGTVERSQAAQIAVDGLVRAALDFVSRSGGDGPQ